MVWLGCERIYVGPVIRTVHAIHYPRLYFFFGFFWGFFFLFCFVLFSFSSYKWSFTYILGMPAFVCHFLRVLQRHEKIPITLYVTSVPRCWLVYDCDLIKIFVFPHQLQSNYSYTIYNSGNR